MARRSTLSPAKPAFAPPSDPATYSDLLLFENRLKGNALSLNRRKSRYQCAFPFDVRLFSVYHQICLTFSQVILAQLILVICFLLSEVLLQTSFLIIPYKLVLCYVFPEVYPSTADVDAQLHPYFTSGLLFVAVTTLVLFFATGVYAEKIGYANRCVHISLPFNLHYFEQEYQLCATREPCSPELQHVSQYAHCTPKINL